MDAFGTRITYHILFPLLIILNSYCPQSRSLGYVRFKCIYIKIRVVMNTGKHYDNQVTKHTQNN